MTGEGHSASLPSRKHEVERYPRDFVRAGAQLSEIDKVRLRELNQEESRLSTAFQNKLLAATKAAAVVVNEKSELEGLSEGQIEAAAEAAKERGLPGKYVIVLQNTTQHPAQASLKNRALRQRLFEASTQRAEHGDTNDTRDIIRRLAQLRSEKGALLGFPTYAGYVLDKAMAKTPEAAVRLLQQLVPPATAKARRDADQMQALIDRRERQIQAGTLGLAVLRRTGAQGAVRPGPGANQALLRAQPSLAGRSVLRGQSALWSDLQGAEGHSGVPSRREGVRGL